MWKYFIQLLFAVCISAVAYAGEIKSVSATLDGSKGELQPGTISRAYDTLFFTDQQSNAKKISATDIKNIITFQLNEASPLFLKAPFKATLTYRLKYSFKNSFSKVDSLSDNQVLEITYDTASNKPFSARKSIEFNDAVDVTLTIISITTDANGWNPLPALMLRNDMVINHTYLFDCEINKVAQIKYLAPTQLNADELKVFWDKSQGVDEYDLEWTYIDETMYATNAYGTPGSAAFEKNIFRNRASRVTLNATSEEYLIPLLYESKGYVFFRVRGVQLSATGKRFETNWSAYNQYNFVPGHQPKLNWQATTSYAEEGKRKSVVQYFDGSLRNRQTVTKDNTTQTTVVAETKYDYQGRPAIQVLPAPTLNSIIAHTPNFNNFLNTGEVYNNYKDVYEQLKQGKTICDAETPGLDKAQGGAAQYYSDVNPNKGDGINQFIPDSKGFPYTETRYTPDNTGRIKAQGGVGPDHQLNSGHETKYYYSTPDQVELDALFGTEVGNASHYFKNMVKDANGQYSVSYIDMHGRTIATALAGELPSTTKLDYLPSKNEIYNKNSVVTKTITSPENNMIKGLVIESSKALIVTDEGNHHFKYSLLPDNISIEDCEKNNSICYSCSYDLEITISDDCGNIQFPGKKPYVFNAVVGNIETDCEKIASLFAKEFDLNLQQGNYIINKKLTIRDEALRAYEEDFASKNICKTLDEFVQEQANIFMENGGCESPCTACTAQLGTSKAAFVSKFIADNNLDANSTSDVNFAGNAYDKLAEQCKEFCSTTQPPTYIDILKKLMEMDMTPPYGQYAVASETPVFVAANGNTTNIYNIFNYADAAKTKMWFQSGLSALTEDVAVMRDGVSTLKKPFELTKEEFIANFKPAWAIELVKVLHPERIQLNRLETAPTNDRSYNVGRSSYQWDLDFQKTDTYAEALQKGYLNPTYITTAAILNKYPTTLAKSDPFFRVQTSERTAMNTLLNNVNKNGTPVTSIWQAASIIGFCPDPASANCTSQYRANPFPTNTQCPISLDYAWQAFRSTYLGIKDELTKATVTTGTTPVPSKYKSYFSNTTSTLSNATGITNFEDKTQTENALNSFYSGDGSVVYQTGNIGQTKVGNGCSDYREIWWSQLSPCNLEALTEYKAGILGEMETVCQKGMDKDHYLGASSIAPNTTNAFKNFDEVLKHFVEKNNTEHPDKPINLLDCNGSLITFPAPYSQPQVVANKPIISKPEACECERINNLYDTYTAEKRDADFSAYIKRTLQTEISNEDLQTLRGLCDNSITCKFIPKIYLPPALQCGMENVCLPCNTVAQAYSSFRQQNPDYIPTIEEPTYEQQKINRLFAHFMNQQLGFTKSTVEYLTFVDECKDVDQNISCSNLETIVKNYNYSVNPYRFRTLTQSNYIQPAYNDDLHQIVSDGYLRWPKAIRDTTTREWVYFQNTTSNYGGERFCLDKGYTIEWRFKSLKDVLLPNDDVFYFQDENAYFVVSKVKKWKRRIVFKTNKRNVTRLGIESCFI